MVEFVHIYKCIFNVSLFLVFFTINVKICSSKSLSETWVVVQLASA